MTVKTQFINGVNVDQLMDTIQAIKGNPDLAKFNFKAHTDWINGGFCQTTIKEFYGAGKQDDSRDKEFVLKGDEPSILLGSNKAPNAVETVLHALTSCLTVGFIYNAAAQGIEVKKLDFDTKGELDLHAFLGLSEEKRPGYSNITVNYSVKCDAPKEKVEELCAYVQKTSPVLDIIRNPVQVNVNLINYN